MTKYNLAKMRKRYIPFQKIPRRWLVLGSLCREPGYYESTTPYLF